MKIDISNGELVDKVSILAIKKMKIASEEKLVNIRKEFDTLHAAMLTLGIDENDTAFKALMTVNLALWEIEDKIRIKESKKAFDEEFIQLARSVYFENDRRAAIKRKINIATQSQLIEEKEYVNYL